MSVKQVARSGEPTSELGTLACITAPEPPRAVSEAIIPLGKPRRVMTELVTARTDVPRFGYQLHSCQYRILPQSIEESRTGIKPIGLPPQRNAEIEPKSVDVE